MKAIQLKSLTLRNWRGEKERTTLFHTDGTVTTICGANGLGKSRHMDAFCWLLFGKDSQDRKDFNLRSQDSNGEPLHHCECSVEGTLLVDGKEITIKREYKEQWTKPRGQVEEVFKGNITECTWDGTPVRVNDFRSRISEEIIDETIFKLVTSVDYFLSLKQDKQRELLLSLAGAKTDEELAQGNKEFLALLDSLSGKSLSDYRKQVAAEKKRLKAAAAEISPRIDQVQKMMPQTEDWSALERALADEQKDLEHNNSLMHSETARMADAHAKKMLLENEMTILKKNLQTILDDAKDKASKEAEAKNESRNKISSTLKSLNTNLSSITISVNRAKERIAECTQRIKGYNDKLSTLRQQWSDINQESFPQDSAICPYCGKPLSGEKLQEAQDKFQADKQSRLSENVSTGKALAAEKKTYEDELSQQQFFLDDLLQEKGTTEAALSEAYEAFNATTLVTPAEVNPNEIPEYQEGMKQLQAIEAQLSSPTADGPTSEDVLSQTIQDIQSSINDLQARLAKRETIAKYNQEIGNLMEEGRTLAQKIADIERQEYVAAQFSRARIDDCEARLNSLFSMIRWKLFDATLDGNEFDVCIPLVNGVAYSTCNTATQINAGIDIANTLARHYQVYAPLFVDRAESCNSITADSNAQLILLQVTTDKKLIVK